MSLGFKRLTFRYLTLKTENLKFEKYKWITIAYSKTIKILGRGV